MRATRTDRWTILAAAGIVLAGAALLGLAGALAQSWQRRTAGAAAGPGLCRPMAFAGADYLVCRIDLRTHAIALRLRDEAGAPFGGARRLAAALAAKGENLDLAMNGGMYHEDRGPVGLYVEDGVERHAASTSDGFGNFHMKPNGIFWIAGARAGVEETDKFLAAARHVDQATQSGPMLVLGGALHPRFIEGSTSLNTRNGVGVLDDGATVVLAISARPVNFIDFARLLRDGLGCRDALYLDGSVSSLSSPADRIEIVGEPRLGPLIAVTKKR